MYRDILCDRRILLFVDSIYWPFLLENNRLIAHLFNYTIFLLFLHFCSAVFIVFFVHYRFSHWFHLMFLFRFCLSLLVGNRNKCIIENFFALLAFVCKLLIVFFLIIIGNLWVFFFYVLLNCYWFLDLFFCLTYTCHFKSLILLLYLALIDC